MKKKVIIISLLIIIMAILGTIAFIKLKPSKTENKEVSETPKTQQETKNETEKTPEPEEKEESKLKPLYCLLLGINEHQGQLLTDTIMVCAYYPEQKQASILSIPRDTYIGEDENTATSYDKINAIYQIENGGKEGAEKTLKEVSKLTGLEINNYVVLNTSGLIEIVDAVGGVNFEVPIDMNFGYPNEDFTINLKKGTQIIDGEKAEQLLRFRHNNDGTTYPKEYGIEDFGRMRTQREFIIALVKQVLENKNLEELGNIAAIATKNAETNLKISDLLMYVPKISDIQELNINAEYLPGTSSILGTQKLWFYKVDKEETSKIVNKLFNSYEN